MVVSLHMLVAPEQVESSPTRDRTRVPCIGRWILTQCVTREVLMIVLFDLFWIFKKITGKAKNKKKFPCVCVYTSHTFHVLAVVNSAAMDIGECVSF